MEASATPCWRFLQVVRGMRATLRYLERPKGCLRILSLLAEDEEVCISEIISRCGISQDNAYSSLRRLLVFDLVLGPDGCPKSKKRMMYSLTQNGKDLAKLLRVFFNSAQYVQGREDLSSLLSLPVGSLELLAMLQRGGAVSLTGMLREGVCKHTAQVTLETLQRLKLIHVNQCREAGRRTKKYNLTKRGSHLAQILELVEEKLDEISSFRVYYIEDAALDREA